MGAASSSSLPDWTGLLGRLGGPDPIPHDDPYWQHLLSSSSLSSSGPHFLATEDPHNLATVADPHLSRMVERNSETHNCQTLLIHTISLLNEVPSGSKASGLEVRDRGTERKASAILASAANALHLFGAVIRLAAEGAAASPAEFSALFEVPPSLPLPTGLVLKGRIVKVRRASPLPPC